MPGGVRSTFNASDEHEDFPRRRGRVGMQTEECGEKKTRRRRVKKRIHRPVCTAYLELSWS